MFIILPTAAPVTVGPSLSSREGGLQVLEFADVILGGVF